MDESAVAFHTPETKEESKQWLPIGTPGPLKARVQESRKKQMVFSFFDAEGVIYQHYAEIGAKLNALYLIEVLDAFLRIFRRKRPVKSKTNWILHWDNSPLHTAKVTKDCLASKRIQTLPHPPYSPDLAPCDFFLFPTLKSELSGITIASSTIRSAWERASKSVSVDRFATAFQRWLERHEKCVRLEGGYVEKSQ